MKKLLALISTPLLLALSANAQSDASARAFVPDASKTYCIVSKVFSDNIYETTDGKLAVGARDVSTTVYWRFEVADASVPTYYIRNAQTGNYFQSCNKSLNTQILTGTTPVAYYVGHPASGDNAGNYYFSSADCANYLDNSQSPRGLNRHGSQQIVIAWNAGLTNNGSYWNIEEVEADFEPHPFTTSTAIGQPAIVYHMTSPDGLYLSDAPDWEQPAETSALSWYFVGTSNKDGGYQIVNSATDTPLKASNGTDRWLLSEVEIGGETRYAFTSAEGSEVLSAQGVSTFLFRVARSRTAMRLQIYDIPCGATNGQYFTKANLAGEACARPLTYPIRTQSGTAKTTTQQDLGTTTWYKINVLEHAELIAGKPFVLSLGLNKTPSSADAVYAYFDWDCNGVFETVRSIAAAKTMTDTITVPASAVNGKSRLRLRVTQNGEAGPDDDVLGQTLDLLVSVSHADEPFTAEACVNDPLRGTAQIDGTTAMAEPFGGSTFICWKEGKRVVSVRQSYTFNLDHNVLLTACFAADVNDPYGEEVATGIGASPVFDTNVEINIAFDSRTIRAVSTANVVGISLYNTNGALLRSSRGNSLPTDGLAAGTYIVKVYTDKNDAAAKILVK